MEVILYVEIFMSKCKLCETVIFKLPQSLLQGMRYVTKKGFLLNEPSEN